MRVEEVFDAEALDGAEALERVVPLRTEIRAWVRPERGVVRVSGDLTARVRAECDRCLKPMEIDVDGRFDQRYEVAGAARGAGGPETEIPVGELDLELLDAPVLDTKALALEQIELHAPIRTVCSETCAGLCPTCGADLNTTACGCETQPTDPRWDALKKFEKS